MMTRRAMMVTLEPLRFVIVRSSVRVMPTSDVLPPLYARWMDEMLGAEIPAEPNATCSDCAMLVSESDAAAGANGFNPLTKCCTFLPDMWNFLAGGVLIDDDPAMARGKASLEARIDGGIAVTPLGLRRPRAYQVLYDTGNVDLFGRSTSMRCPHYIEEGGGLCGVWRHRESTCTTWFCKLTRGGLGREFWQLLQQLLRGVELSLAAWCLTELHVDEAVLRRLYRPSRDVDVDRPNSHELDRDPDLKALQALWGSWRGRERELYVSCARLVETLDWGDVQRIGGSQVAVYAYLARQAHERLLNNDPPERPRAALVQITPRGERIRLATYSQMDALDVPASVARALPYFDGRPLDETLAAIQNRERVSLDPSFVRKLADFGVLRDDAPAELTSGPATLP